ncbi:SRPBCC family protein, partial [Aeromicrobium sp.]|uniref:SRPBCC family protein n=1 Tax=Aeromicrobium sp. TaxID=1871063 RepID=UPI003C3C35CB
MSTHVVTSVTVEIAAPASFVWDVLVDYASYPEWNPYTIAVDTTLEIGERIDLTLPNPDGSDGTMLN